MRTASVSLFCIILLAAPAAIRGQEASDLQAVIEKSVAAAGGLENLEKVQKHRGREEGTYYGGGDALPYTATFAFDPPRRFRREIEGAFTVVVNGDKAWIRAGGVTEAMPGEVVKEQQEEQYIGWIVSLVPLVKQQEKFELTSLRGEIVEGRPTVGIQVSSAGHGDVKLFFDRETHDLLKANYRVKSAEQGYAEVEQDQIVREYMDAAGARVPAEVVIHRDGKRYVEARITELKPVDMFEEDVFARP